MAFMVGQKVVCIYALDELARRYRVPEWPKLGSIYTIRHVGPRLDSCVVYLREIINDPRMCRVGTTPVFAEPGFAPEHFRPIVELKTDTGMAILRKLLTDTKIKEKA